MSDGTVRMSHHPSPQWTHAEQLKRLLESAVMNTELRIYKQVRADAEQDADILVEAIDHLWYRNQAMDELNRIFELYGQLEVALHGKQMVLAADQVLLLEPILARIDERLRAPSHRS